MTYNKNKAIQFPSYKKDEYMEVKEDFQFPEEIFIAFAVCNIQCGNHKFIVDGQMQICEKCGELNFRTDVKKYKIVRGNE